MIDMTSDLLTYLRAFQKQFGDIVPLRELPSSVTTDELIEVIKISIQNNENILLQRFGYAELEKDPEILI